MKVAHRYAPDKALPLVFGREKNRNSPAPDLSLSRGDGPGTGQSSGKLFGMTT